MSPPIAPPGTSADALTFSDLDVGYRVRGRNRRVLRGLSLSIGRGEAYGLVGESGCGKSTAALAAVRYLPRNGKVAAGSIAVDGRNLLSLRDAELRHLRANTVSMVYQDPGRALNPSIRVGKQVAEVFSLKGASPTESLRQAAAMLMRYDQSGLEG